MGNKVSLIIPEHCEQYDYPGEDMGIRYVASAIEQMADVKLIDFNKIDRNQGIALIEEFRPKILGVTSMSVNHDNAMSLVRDIISKIGDVLTVYGGYHATTSYQTVLQNHPYVNICAIGEGEETMRSIVTSDNPYSARGIAFRDGESIAYRPQNRVADVNALPFPVRDFNPEGFLIFGGEPTAQIVDSRGCAYGCNFCMQKYSSRLLAESGCKKPIRSRSVSSIIAEILSLKDMGYRNFFFESPVINLDKGHIRELCGHLGKLDISWGGSTRVDLVDPDSIKAMADSGCTYLYCGLESAHPEVLLGMNKTHNPSGYIKSAERAYEVMNRNGIGSSVFLVFGAPKGRKCGDKTEITGQETLEDAKVTLDFVFDVIKPKFIGMNWLRFYPKSDFSVLPQYSLLRPTVDGEEVHGGYYDKEWYQKNGIADLRVYNKPASVFSSYSSIVAKEPEPGHLERIIEYACKKNTDGQCHIFFEDRELRKSRRG